MPRTLKFIALVLLNLVVAVVGTAIVTTEIGRVLPAHSTAAVVTKEWILSIVCAGLIGFGVWRTWRSRAALWTWVVPLLWFGIRFFPAMASGHGWNQLSGRGCAAGVRDDCMDFFVFTIPLVHSAFYTVGACISSLVYAADKSSEATLPHQAGT